MHRLYFCFLGHACHSVSLLPQDSVFIDVTRLFALYSFWDLYGSTAQEAGLEHGHCSCEALVQDETQGVTLIHHVRSTG